MTRPGIVRADTLDLQNQDAPSAQDHSQHDILLDPNNAQLGQHQAAEIRNVRKERHSEELNLQEAWNQAGRGPSPDLTHMQDGEDGFTDEQLQAQHNGIHGDDGEHTDDEDAEQNSDDDMMDRMSSSPSIDDGAYPTTPLAVAVIRWPPRSSSLTPTRGTFNRSATTSPSSSPFAGQQRLSLSPLPVFVSNHNNETQYATSPVSTTRSQDSSPYTLTPEHFPLFAAQSDAGSGLCDGDFSSLSSQLDHHHLQGEYAGSDSDEGYFFDNDDDYAASASEDDHADDIYQPSSNVIALASSASHPFARSTESFTTLLRRAHSPDPAYMRDLFLPDDDPLLKDYDLSDSMSESSYDSSSSWATVSDTCLEPDGGNTGILDRTRDDDSDDLSFYSDERFVDSGWGGECLRETEDIDFDFVYALHTFVATVEGQANATKGDTMVLLDDSNSYWWLVRIVKDSSIGYLPAEHIETPTERLARLNKHRNVDLSQAMLGDNMEKTKNPLKKAIKRRNAKTVQFAAPTYVEASDYEYDTEDEENALLADVYSNGAAQQEDGASTVTATEADHAEHKESSGGVEEPKSRLSDSSSSDDAKDVKPPVEEPLGSPTLIDSTEAAPLKSRKGTPRNADSFLKDESAEPRRITLTPNILRDDGSSMSSLEKTRSTSFDSLEKTAAMPDKAKDDKKKKEKKQGMLSGLFKSKKKDKKGKAGEDDSLGDGERMSGESARQNTSAPTSPTLERNSSLADKKGRLQKAPPTSTNPPVISAPIREISRPIQPPPLQIRQQQDSYPTEFFAELEGSQVAYEAPTGQEDQIREIQSRQSNRSPEVPAPPLHQSSSMAALTAITNRIRPNSDEPQVKKQKVKKAKQRVELDDFDESSRDEDYERSDERLSESPVEITHGTFMHGTEAVHIPMNIDDLDSSTPGDRTPDERASEEYDRASSPSMLDMPTEGEPLQVEEKRRPETAVSEDTNITDDDPTPVPSKPQSPDTAIFTHHPGLPNLQQSPTPPPARQAPFPPTLKNAQKVEGDQRAPSQNQTQRAASPASTVSTQPSPVPSPVSAVDSTFSKDTTHSWSDASLRAWLDGGEGNDVRDMLVVIHDKSDVQPVRHDHPLMKGLWDDERSSCNRMMGELDGLLGSWLGKKQSSSRDTSPTITNTSVPSPVIGS